MKRLSMLLVLIAVGLFARAQSLTVTQTTPACNNDGVLVATPSGMTPPYTVTWMVAGMTGISAGLTLTNYNGGAGYVAVTDANGISAYAQIVEAYPFQVDVATTAASCPANGSGTITVTGGAAPYSYLWLSSGVPVAATATASLPGGLYTVVVTDANGCVVNTTNDSGGNGVLIEDLPAFSYSLTSTAASCTNGTLSVGAITGGVSPFTYLWSNGATTPSLTGLVQGSYNVTVTDAQGCSLQNYGYVQQTPFISVTATNTPATCTQNDGASIIFGSGGTPPYTYLWSNGATTQSLTGLSSGSLSVAVMDANGCTGTGYAYISASTPITVTYSTTASSCTAATGSATVSVAGGAAPYTITWNTYPAQTGATASGLAAGNYAFHVTDANGCVQNGSVYVPPTTVLSGSIAATQPVCLASNGTAAMNISGGTSYTYAWSNGATTQSITGLAAGSYSVTATDASGCSLTKYAFLAPSSPINLGLVTTPVTCLYSTDGAVTANATGGTGPYNYTWSNSAVGNSISGVGMGGYSVYVTDGAGCTGFAYGSVGNSATSTACYCTLYGTVYNDVNANCTPDAGEEGIPNIQIHCAGFGYAYTNDSGNYQFLVPTGSYTLSETILSQYPLSPCQSNALVVNVTAGAGCGQYNAFANSSNPLHDIHISTWDVTQAVPGNQYYQKIIISNQGTVTEPNVVAGYKADGQLGAANFIPSVVFVNNGADYWNVTTGNLSLSPAEASASYADYAVPTNIPMGTSILFKDTAAYTAPISNWLNDNSPWNNVNYYTTSIVSSYDPNFKEVSPRGTGAEGYIMAGDSVLEYAVHFQNLGTYMAQNIYVLDTLDADMDWTTLRPTYLSHPGSVSMSDAGVLKASFPNIHLVPKTTSDVASNGMFTYTIRRKNNLATGTQLTNSASIYFDYNAPVQTNTTLNTLAEPTGVENAGAAAGSGLRVFPNPAGNSFFVESAVRVSGTAQLTIANAQGQTVVSGAVPLVAGSNKTQVDATSLSAGVYFVTLSGPEGAKTAKLVIVK